MKPYGLRPGDGVKSPRKIGFNKFSHLVNGGGPRGKNRESKIHRERCLVHRQARSDVKKEIRKELHDALYRADS